MMGHLGAPCRTTDGVALFASTSVGTEAAAHPRPAAASAEAAGVPRPRPSPVRWTVPAGPNTRPRGTVRQCRYPPLMEWFLPTRASRHVQPKRGRAGAAPTAASFRLVGQDRVKKPHRLLDPPTPARPCHAVPGPQQRGRPRGCHPHRQSGRPTGCHSHTARADVRVRRLQPAGPWASSRDLCGGFAVRCHTLAREGTGR